MPHEFLFIILGLIPNKYNLERIYDAYLPRLLNLNFVFRASRLLQTFIKRKLPFISSINHVFNVD